MGRLPVPEQQADIGEHALFDVKLLRLMNVLYATRSVSRAAEQLGQSQPTVSIWLARLRKELSDPLFVRTTEGMLPTPRTDALIEMVREVLAGMQRLAETEARFDPATTGRAFRIFMTDAAHITMLPRLFTHVHSLAPKVRLEAVSIDARLAQALQAGEADLALGFVPGLEAGFYQQALFGQDWVCLVNASHPRIGEILTRDQYIAEAHVGITLNSGKLLDAMLGGQGIERRVLLELPGFLGLSATLCANDLIATLPRRIGETLARSNPELRVLACPVRTPYFIIKQYWYARYHHDAGNRWLRSVCATLFTDESRNASGSFSGLTAH